MTTIEERLARIEAAQEAQNERLDKLVDLMERTVRLEERHDHYVEALRRIGGRVERLEQRVEAVEITSQHSNWSVSNLERLLWLAATAVAGSSQYWIKLLGAS